MNRKIPLATTALAALATFVGVSSSTHVRASRPHLPTSLIHAEPADRAPVSDEHDRVGDGPGRPVNDPSECNTAFGFPYSQREVACRTDTGWDCHRRYSCPNGALLNDTFGKCCLDPLAPPNSCFNMIEYQCSVLQTCGDTEIDDLYVGRVNTRTRCSVLRKSLGSDSGGEGFDVEVEAILNEGRPAPDFLYNDGDTHYGPYGRDEWLNLDRFVAIEGVLVDPAGDDTNQNGFVGYTLHTPLGDRTYDVPVTVGGTRVFRSEPFDGRFLEAGDVGAPGAYYRLFQHPSRSEEWYDETLPDPVAGGQEATRLLRVFTNSFVLDPGTGRPVPKRITIHRERFVVSAPGAGVEKAVKRVSSVVSDLDVARGLPGLVFTYLTLPDWIGGGPNGGPVTYEVTTRLSLPTQPGSAASTFEWGLFLGRPTTDPAFPKDAATVNRVVQHSAPTPGQPAFPRADAVAFEYTAAGRLLSEDTGKRYTRYGIGPNFENESNQHTVTYGRSGPQVVRVTEESTFNDAKFGQNVTNFLECGTIRFPNDIAIKHTYFEPDEEHPRRLKSLLDATGVTTEFLYGDGSGPLAPREEILETRTGGLGQRNVWARSTGGVPYKRQVQRLADDLVVHDVRQFDDDLLLARVVATDSGIVTSYDYDALGRVVGIENLGVRKALVRSAPTGNARAIERTTLRTGSVSTPPLVDREGEDRDEFGFVVGKRTWSVDWNGADFMKEGLFVGTRPGEVTSVAVTVSGSTATNVNLGWNATGRGLTSLGLTAQGGGLTASGAADAFGGPSGDWSLAYSGNGSGVKRTTYLDPSGGTVSASTNGIGTARGYAAGPSTAQGVVSYSSLSPRGSVKRQETKTGGTGANDVCE